jgi:putative SOS response-associated peptidase YedK
MCYFNGTKVTRDEKIRLKHLEKLVAQYNFLNRDVINGFDFGYAIVLKPLKDTEDFELVQMEWGFLPDPLQWPFIETREQAFTIRKGYKDPRGKYHEGLNFLNAVGEELLFKNKVYRRAALERRCIILSTGFYDWRHVYPLNKRTGEPVKTAKKYPYRVSVKNREYFWMAGIWQPWTDAETGETIDTCAIITTAANLVMEQIHNSKKRMPTMLTDDLAWEWMFEDLTEKRITEIATWKIPWEDLNFYTLSKDFLNSNDPTKAFYYPDLPPIILPGVDDSEKKEQLQLF